MVRVLLVFALAIAAVATLIFALPEPDTAPGQAQTGLIIRNVQVFDGGGRSAAQSLVIEGAVITAIGPQAQGPTGAREIDASGLTALPGLIDAHTHTWGDGLEATLGFGVTAHLDMFSAVLQLPASRAAREDLTLSNAADLFSAGMLATAPGGHGTQFGVPVQTLSAPDQADAWVAARKREGSDYIKLVYMPDARRFGGLDLATAQAVIEAAQAHDLMAVAHIATLEDAREMVSAGVDGLVHIFADAPVDDAFIAQARDADIFIIPTLSVIASVAGTGAGAELAADPRIANRLSPASRRGLEGGFGAPPSRLFQYPLAEENVRRLHGAGITLLAGSDAPNPGTAYGASLHQEMALLVEAGMSPAEAITAATAAPAERFNLERRGHLTPGGRADILLVSGDPVTAITDTRNIEAVIRNGRLVGPVDPRREGAGQRMAEADISAFDRPTNGFTWSETTDAMMGGDSNADWSQAAGVARIEYAVRSGFAAPWAGLGYFPVDPAAPALDLSGQTELVMRLRASPGAYRVMFFMPGAPGAPPTVTVELSEQFAEYRLDLTAVDGFDQTAFAGLAIVSGPQPSQGFIELAAARFEAPE